MGRGSRESKRIYNKFEYWSVTDCDCSLCLHHAGKDQPCSLDACCIEDIRQEDIRQEAIRREQTDTPDGDVSDGAIGVIGIDVSKEVTLSALDR